MIDVLKSKIEGWAVDRNLHTDDPTKQMLKLFEELGELSAAMARSNDDGVIDAVGDIFVVLTILCQQMGIDIGLCIQSAYDEIKDRRGVMRDGVFIKEADL